MAFSTIDRDMLRAGMLEDRLTCLPQEPPAKSNLPTLSNPPPSAQAQSELKPSYIGFIKNGKDVALLIELGLEGKLNFAKRRPHESERPNVVRSGNVYVYEEETSGIKRWTDGANWSPSRILGNFLIYRQVKESFVGENGKKTALRKKSNGTPSGSKLAAIRKRRSSSTMPQAVGLYDFNSSGPSSFDFNQEAAAQAGLGPLRYHPSDDPRALEDKDLYGSLITSYPFLENGLVKKTITLVLGECHYHVISYYSADDVRSGRLSVPSHDSKFEHITVRPALMTNKAWRTPIDREPLEINQQSNAYISSYPVQPVQFPSISQQSNEYSASPITAPQIPVSLPLLPVHGASRLPADGLPSTQMPSFPEFNFHQHDNFDGGAVQAVAQSGLDALNGAGHYQQNASHQSYIDYIAAQLYNSSSPTPHQLPQYSAPAAATGNTYGAFVQPEAGGNNPFPGMDGYRSSQSATSTSLTTGGYNIKQSGEEADPAAAAAAAAASNGNHLGVVAPAVQQPIISPPINGYGGENTQAQYQPQLWGNFSTV